MEDHGGAEGDQMSISVIIPSQTPGNLVPCASSIRALDPAVKIVCVWDRSDGNGEAPNLECLDRTIESNQPFIFARNVNLGIWVTPPDDVVLMNDDAILRTPGGITG